MRQGYRLAGFTALLVLVPLAIGADNKNAKEVDKPTTQQDYNQLQQAGQISGKLTRFDAKTRTFTLEIEYEYLEANNKGGNNTNVQRQLQQQQQILREQQRILQSRNPVDRQRRMQQLIARIQRDQLQAAGKNQNGAFKVVTAHKDFELQAAADAKVRTLLLPEAFDEKGSLKKYTPQELKELKGADANLPGYKSSMDDLEVGQTVKIYLAKGKPVSKDKEVEADKPQVSLLVIEKQAEPTPGKGKKKK